jgi:hypothetical protein
MVIVTCAAKIRRAASHQSSGQPTNNGNQKDTVHRTALIWQCLGNPRLPHVHRLELKRIERAQPIRLLLLLGRETRRPFSLSRGPMQHQRYFGFLITGVPGHPSGRGTLNAWAPPQSTVHVTENVNRVWAHIWIFYFKLEVFSQNSCGTGNAYLFKK